MDARGIPTNICASCGSNWFNMKVAMENGEVTAFLFDATCMHCGTLVTIACPKDLEAQQNGRIED